MDVLEPRDSLNSLSDHDPLFYTSDEFMVELLKSPVRKETKQKNLVANTQKAIDIMKAPPSPAEPHDFRQKLMQLLDLQTSHTRSPSTMRHKMEKAHSFTSKFSDGVVVQTIKSPTKGNQVKRKVSASSALSPNFQKSLPSGVARRNVRSASSSCIDISTRSDEGPAAFRTTLYSHDTQSVESSPASLPPKIALDEAKSWISSSSEWSDDLSQSSASQSKAHPPLQRMMYPVDEDVVNEDNIPPPPTTMTSLSSHNDVTSRSLRKSASAGLEGVVDSDDAQSANLSKSSSTKRLSFQVGAYQSSNLSQSPKQERRSSKWLMNSPAPSPHTPRSRKSSRGSGNSRKSSRNFMHGIPMLPFDDNEEGGAEETMSAAASPRKPPLIRPLDKTLMRDYPSTTTATTFLTADTDAIDYSMSSMFPLTKETERIILKRVPNKRDILIEKSDGEKLGMIDFSMVNQGKRLIKDACGRTCALIFLNSDPMGGNNIFKICGNRPATRRQRLSNETGYYTWAEVKNTGSLGGKFVMNRFSAETSSCSAEQHSTKPFGSLFSRGKSRGYVFFDENKKECVKMVSLQKGKGIIVGPNRDLCLMLAYVACVDEMVEHRLR